MKRTREILAFAALAVGLGLFASVSSARADNVVYNTIDAQFGDSITQQTGNAFYYVGDTPTIIPTTDALTTIKIPFFTTYYSTTGNGPGFDYTPSLQLDLYSTLAGASSGIGLLGSATVDNVTFTNDGIVVPVYNYNLEDEHTLSFDFTSQNIILPANFAFAFRDTPPVGSSVDGANGLSVAMTDQESGSPGFINTTGAFVTYSAPDPFSPPVPEFYYADPVNGYTQLNVEAQISTVPEPAGTALLVISGMALLGLRSRRPHLA